MASDRMAGVRAERQRCAGECLGCAVAGGNCGSWLLWTGCAGASCEGQACDSARKRKERQEIKMRLRRGQHR